MEVTTPSFTIDPVTLNEVECFKLTVPNQAPLVPSVVIVTGLYFDLEDNLGANMSVGQAHFSGPKLDSGTLQRIIQTIMDDFQESYGGTECSAT